MINRWKRVYYSHVTQRDRLEIDTFLPNWQRQVRDLCAYWTPSPIVPIVHECASFAKEGKRGGGRVTVVTRWRTGSERANLRNRPSWKQTWPQNQHANSPNNYSDCPTRPQAPPELPWFRATARYVVYIALLMYGVYTSVRRDWVTSYGSVEADLNRRNPKGRGVSLLCELWETFNFVKYGLRRSWLSAIARTKYVHT